MRVVRVVVKTVTYALTLPLTLLNSVSMGSAASSVKINLRTEGPTSGRSVTTRLRGGAILLDKSCSISKAQPPIRGKPPSVEVGCTTRSGPLKGARTPNLACFEKFRSETEPLNVM